MYIFTCLHVSFDIFLILECLVAIFQINVCSNASDDLMKWSILSSRLGQSINQRQFNMSSNLNLFYSYSINYYMLNYGLHVLLKQSNMFEYYYSVCSELGQSLNN